MKTPQKISHEKFTWEKFILRCGFATHQFYDPETNFLIDSELIGYCDAKNLRIRPRDEGIAVLVLDKNTQEEVWFHLTGLPIGWPDGKN